MALTWVLVVLAHWTRAQYYTGRCPCPVAVQPLPRLPHGPCPPPIPCPPVPPSCQPVPGGLRTYPSYSTPVFPPVNPLMQHGRGYGYILPQPYAYYMKENELPRLQKQIKTIEISDEKAHTSPFDTVEVTPVKTVETASETRIVSPQTEYIHTPFPEPSHYPPIGMGSILLQPSPSDVVPANVVSPPMQPFAYHIPIPEPTASTRPFLGHIQSPINDCCIRCSVPCHYRARRNLRAHDDKTKSDESNGTKCTDEKLKSVMTKAIKSSAASSKRQIQKLAEEAFDGDFHVICSYEDFSYVSRTNTFCQASNDGIFCYAFQTEPNRGSNTAKHNGR